MIQGVVNFQIQITKFNALTLKVIDFNHQVELSFVSSKKNLCFAVIYFFKTNFLWMTACLSIEIQKDLLVYLRLFVNYFWACPNQQPKATPYFVPVRR